MIKMIFRLIRFGLYFLPKINRRKKIFISPRAFLKKKREGGTEGGCFITKEVFERLNILNPQVA